VARQDVFGRGTRCHRHPLRADARALQRRRDEKLLQDALALACIKAYELWGEARHLQAATELAQVVWERGLMRKGIGLCRGIGGNGYVFLFELTQDSTYLQRAVCFAQFALEGSHRDKLLVQADAPSSLANGRAGLCVLPGGLHRAQPKCRQHQ